MQGRRILLGVTGGIAAYKSPDLVRRLIERGAEVQVVMSAGAGQFVTPLTFQAVSGRPVRDTLWDPAAEAAMGHIELARWAELIVIAPATAHCIASLAQGLAADLLGTLCLATEARLIVAPAMNRIMWAHPATQANVALLQQRGVRVIGPAAGSQACGETGDGRMLEPLEIADAVSAHFGGQGPLRGRTVLVTAGPTRERIDPVRFISNRSSGKMGYAIAQAARDAGARVILISGPVNLPAPSGVQRINIESADDMLAAVRREIAGTDIYISTAAVADYRPANPACQKIKKTESSLDLALERTTDVLTSVSTGHPRPAFVVGFAAETENVERNARGKLERKQLDLIAANEVGDDKVFDKDDNALLVLSPTDRVALGPAPKCDLAREFIALVAERFHAHVARQASSTAAAAPRALA